MYTVWMLDVFIIRPASFVSEIKRFVLVLCWVISQKKFEHKQGFYVYHENRTTITKQQAIYEYFGEVLNTKILRGERLLKATCEARFQLFLVPLLFFIVPVYASSISRLAST